MPAPRRRLFDRREDAEAAASRCEPGRGATIGVAREPRPPHRWYIWKARYWRTGAQSAHRAELHLAENGRWRDASAFEVPSLHAPPGFHR